MLPTSAKSKVFVFKLCAAQPLVTKQHLTRRLGVGTDSPPPGRRKTRKNRIMMCSAVGFAAARRSGHQKAKARR